MTATPLRFEDGALLVLDQRALPAEERWIRCTEPGQVAECIRTLAVRGAPAIGIAAGYAMALAEDPVATAPMLRAARPTAVNLGWAVDQLLAADDRLERAHELHREQEWADRRLAALGAERFQPGDRALTHCNAGGLATGGFGSALGALRAAWEQGLLAHVWVDETRPLLQGSRLTAWELDALGIPYAVIADSAAAHMMSSGEVDCVVTGADRIAANGDCANKIGTYGLAVAAAHHGIPLYVVAPTSTIDVATPTGAEIPLEERDGAEITSRFPARNPAFDVTPAALVAAIVTEAGVHRAPYAESLPLAGARS